MSSNRWLEVMAGSWRTMMSMKSSPDKVRSIAAELRALEADNHRLRLGDMSVGDYQRLVEWIKNPNRKDTSSAFTAGAARTAAIAVQDSGVFKQQRAASALAAACRNSGDERIQAALAEFNRAKGE